MRVGRRCRERGSRRVIERASVERREEEETSTDTVDECEPSEQKVDEGVKLVANAAVEAFIGRGIANSSSGFQPPRSWLRLM
jgi:hypothetical protein